MKKILFLTFAITLLLFSSCRNTMFITQGQDGYAGELDEKYELVEIKEISSSSNCHFGFGPGKGYGDGVITNFYGVNLKYNQSNFLRLLTFISYAAILPSTAVNEENMFLNVMGGLVIGGVLNNLTWINTSTNVAIRQANLKLMQENPDVDLFVYPKYNIQYSTGLFNNRADVKIYSKGAKLKIK